MISKNIPDEVNHKKIESTTANYFEKSFNIFLENIGIENKKIHALCHVLTH